MKEDIPKVKICTKCLVEKPMLAFSKKTGGKYKNNPIAKSAVRKSVLSLGEITLIIDLSIIKTTYRVRS